jgi:hypothetical protein
MKSLPAYDTTFTADDLGEWDRGIAAAREGGGLVFSLLYFVVSGEVPRR